MIGRYIDENLKSSLAETVKELVLIVLVLTIFDIISMNNLFVSFQHFVNIEDISIAGLSMVLLWVARALIKIVFFQH